MGRHGLLALKVTSAPAGTSPEYHPELEASKHLAHIVLISFNSLSIQHLQEFF